MGLLRQTVSAISAVMCLIIVVSGARTQAQTGEPAPLIPKGTSALEGLPSVRLDATTEDATRRTLDSAEAAKEKLTISVVNGRYFWTSRGNQPLTLRASGEFTYLSSAEPGQYIRFRKINDRLAYVEHVDSALGSVTYWGELRIVLGR